ncbi:MAG: DNA repair protein RadC [Bacteroidales bacterium]|nr:DNA repair protein RadC [Bacteroidales bacterium]
MKISDMSEADRPREKLLRLGAESLGNAELIAVLLRSGRPGESAVEMAHRLLSLVGGRLTGLFECDSGYLASRPGVGTSRAAALVAAFELGRRFMLEAGDPQIALTNAQRVYQHMLPRLKGLTHEESWIILLDQKMQEIKTVKVSVGGRKATVMDKTLIVRKALEAGAQALVLVHNHPTGDPAPSRSDISETRLLQNACDACNLRLLDHIIIADEHFYSFVDEKKY